MAKFEFKTIHIGNATFIQMFVDGVFNREVEVPEEYRGVLLADYVNSAEAFLKYHYYAKIGMRATAATS